MEIIKITIAILNILMLPVLFLSIIYNKSWIEILIMGLFTFDSILVIKVMLNL